MKKLMSIVLALCMALSLCMTTAWADGEDTTWYNEAGVEFVLYDAADLLGFASLVNGGNTFAGKTIKLGADIDLSGVAWTPIGDVGDTAKQFKGDFDGNSKIISGMTMTSGARMGLFSMPTCAYIHDFTLRNVSFTTSEENARIGAVAANLQYWNVVEDVTVDGVTISVTGDDGLIGGAVGYMWKSQMGNVDVKNVTITANGDNVAVGGHTAYARGHIWDTGVIDNNTHWLADTTFGTSVVQNLFLNCDVESADIDITGTGGVVGGFLGYDTYNNHSNYFKSCKVTGLDVNCGTAGSFTVGGFIGINKGSNTAPTVGLAVTEKGFDGCSVSGMISGSAGIYGGFAGSCGGRSHAYDNATANVTITSTGVAGGFVGATQNYLNHAYTFDGCSTTGNVSGTTAGGFVGSIGHGGDGTALNVTMNDCTAMGNVSGTTNAGGLVGTVNDKKGGTSTGTGSVAVKDSIASGAVTGATKGGAIGSTDVGSTSITLNGNNNSTGVDNLVGIQQNNDTLHAINLNRTAVTMLPNDTLTLTATIYPTEGYAVQWESSDDDIATVDENGVVTAVSDGSATITAKLVDAAPVENPTVDDNVETQALTNGEQTPEQQTVYATATCAVTVEFPTPTPTPDPEESSVPAHTPIRRQNTAVTTSDTKADDTTKTDTVISAKTFDAGVSAYAAMAVLSLTGSVWVVGKKRV